MMAYTRSNHGKRSVVVVNATPEDAVLLRDAIALCGNSKYYVLEEKQ